MKIFKQLHNLDFNNLVIDKYLSKKKCNQIIKELNNFGSYDDQVMGGRQRINKGSRNFEAFLKKSPVSNKFFSDFNNYFVFKKIKKFFLRSRKPYYMNFNNSNISFSKKLYGSQSGNKITEYKTDLKRNIIYLDLDFSISKRGYSRGPHRDRDSRIINFLIYLNTLSSKDGGVLQLFNLKSKKLNIKYKRFINKKLLKIAKKIKAKAGKAIFFESSPNSYHSVSNFYGVKNKKRFFIYGSFSLNKIVKWKKNN